jgi:hypothetical protein
MYFPLGARSARKGILSLTRWTSSSVSDTSAVPKTKLEGIY